MLLTAQHVAKPSTGDEGVNVYSYHHGPYVWHGLPPDGIPDQNPGVLVYQSISVDPPGNRVRSYLDVVAPDGTAWTEIRQAFVTFISRNQRNQLPWIDVVGRCWFRINMDLGLAASWHREVADLYHAVAGIDKIEGPGEFTMDKFKGIKIEATGQNIITVGDGNQVNAQYRDVAGALVELKQALLQSSSLTEMHKLDAVADIDSIQSQLAKPSPNRTVIRGAWETVKRLDTVLGLADKITRVAGMLAPFLQ